MPEGVLFLLLSELPIFSCAKGFLQAVFIGRRFLPFFSGLFHTEVSRFDVCIVP